MEPAPSNLLGLVWIDGGVAERDPGLPGPDGNIFSVTIDWRELAPVACGDLGVDISIVLSRALLSLGTVVFIDHFIGVSDGTRTWRRTPGGLLCSLALNRSWRRFGARASPLNVVATNSEAILATLGLAEGGWSCQQQVLLVVPEHSAIDRLDGNVIAGWLGDRPKPDCDATFAAGVRLAMTAGHDGSWCTVHAPSHDNLTALRDTLKDICAEAGLRWVEGKGPEYLRFAGFGTWPEEEPDRGAELNRRETQSHTKRGRAR